jgi:hypothetical protein
MNHIKELIGDFMTRFIFLFIFTISASAFAQEYHIWSELLDYKEVKKSLPLLQNNKVSLHLAINQKDFIVQQKYHAFTEVLRDAHKLGIKVYLWPLVSEEEGYWLNAKNIDLFFVYVNQLVFKLSHDGVLYHGFSFDLEPTPEKTRTMISYLKKFKIKKSIRYLNQFCNSTSEIEDAKVKLTLLIQSLELLGLKTHVVTTPFVLDDFKLNNDKWQRVFGIPFVDSATEYSFMVYSTEYENVIGKITSYPIYEYGMLAQRFLPNKVLGLDLGGIGHVEFPNEIVGFKHFKQIKPDIQASLAAGINQVHFYSLDGLVGEENQNQWFRQVKSKIPRKSLKWNMYLQFQNKIYSKLCPY